MLFRNPIRSRLDPQITRPARITCRDSYIKSRRVYSRTANTIIPAAVFNCRSTHSGTTSPQRSGAPRRPYSNRHRNIRTRSRSNRSLDGAGKLRGILTNTGNRFLYVVVIDSDHAQRNRRVGLPLHRIRNRQKRRRQHQHPQRLQPPHHCLLIRPAAPAKPFGEEALYPPPPPICQVKPGPSVRLPACVTLPWYLGVVQKPQPVRMLRSYRGRPAQSRGFQGRGGRTWLCRGGSGAGGRSASSVSEDGGSAAAGAGNPAKPGRGAENAKNGVLIGLGVGFRRTVC